jgi:MSHA biogenesis protein MshJ
MKDRLVKLAQSVDRLSLRERLFLLGAGLFVIGGLWQAALAGPLRARERLANEKVLALQDRLRNLDASLSAAAEGVNEGMPDQLERARALRESVAQRDAEVRVFTTDLVDPTQMRLVLEELLRRQSGLTLVSAVNRRAVPVLEDEEEGAATATQDAAGNVASDAPKLYRHSFVLTLRGSYLDMLRYLEDVERLPWQIYWSRLELKTDEYPVNDIKLELATLSLDEEGIGV